MNNTNEGPSTDTANESTIQIEQAHEVITADEVAALLRVNRKTVYAAFRQGEIPGGRRIGGTIRFSRQRVLHWLAEGQEHVSRSPKGAR